MATLPWAQTQRLSANITLPYFMYINIIITLPATWVEWVGTLCLTCLPFFASFLPLCAACIFLLPLTLFVPYLVPIYLFTLLYPLPPYLTLLFILCLITYLKHIYFIYCINDLDCNLV